MEYMKKGFKQDKKIILWLFIWFLFGSFLIWKVEEQFFLLLPVFLAFTFSYLIIGIGSFIKWIRHTYSALPFLCFLLFTLIWMAIPMEELQARSYLSAHETELQALQETIVQDIEDGISIEQRYTLEDGSILIPYLDDNQKDYYYLIIMDTLPLVTPKKWLVYTSSDTIDSHSIELKIKDIVKLQKHYYYVDGTQLLRTQNKGSVK